MKAHIDISPLVLPSLFLLPVFITGISGFGYAYVNHNGIFLLGFLLVFVPISLLALLVGVIFSARACQKVPKGHWGRKYLGALCISIGILCLLGVLVLGSGRGQQGSPF
jgi:hypothetical protein